MICLWKKESQWGWNIIAGVELMGASQIMQGFVVRDKAFRFYSKCDVGSWKGFKQGDNLSNVLK